MNQDHLFHRALETEHFYINFKKIVLQTTNFQNRKLN